jgi:ParB/RepB/Spo0J family partition protein
LKFKEFKWIPLNALKVSNENIRKTLIDREKDALKRSIRALNVMDALTVVYNEDDQVYEIIKGQRRFLAAVELKKEGFPIKELPCVVKEIEKPLEVTKESLVDELERVAVEANDTGKAILKLVEKFGSVNKVAQELGVSEDWLNYYIQHLSLNEPAPAFEEQTNNVKTKNLEDFNKQETTTESVFSDQLGDLSLEERKEAERRITESPKISIPVIKTATKDWMENSREFIYRVDEMNYQALSDWAKNGQPKVTISIEIEMPAHDQGIPIRRAMDILVNELLKEYLRKIHFRT